MNQWAGSVRDEDVDIPVTASVDRFRGQIWGVRSDDIQIYGHHVTRDFVVHTGAVGVIALDEHDRVLLVRQYRHPVGQYLFEPPAGLLDKVTGFTKALLAKGESAKLELRLR